MVMIVLYFHLKCLGPQFEQLMQQFRAEMEASPPLTGSYTPRPGELCACKFIVDGEWYRARVEKVASSNKISVFYVDFGNVSTVLYHTPKYEFVIVFCSSTH